MRKKPILKGTSFSLRVPPKIRYGIDLLCQRDGVQLSTFVVNAIEAEFERQGLTAKKKYEMLSLLDKLWDESPGIRLVKLEEHAPELMTREDLQKLTAAIDIGLKRGSPLTGDELDQFIEGWPWDNLPNGDVPPRLLKLMEKAASSDS